MKKLTFMIAAVVMMVLPLIGWGQTTATQTSFTDISGNVNNDAKVSYYAYKGGGTSNPAVNSNAIRLYQGTSSTTGGYVVIGVDNGYEITSATIQSTMATTTGYKLTDTNPGSTTPEKSSFNVNNYSLTANTDYTVSNISTQYITFACFGTSSSSRLYLSKISITYQSIGGGSTTYTVTYDCNGGTSGCPENVTGITAGTSITLAAAPSKTDYTFDGWSDGTTTYDADDSYTVNGNVTMTAQWTATSGGGGTTTYTFTSKAWAATPENWTSGKDGNQFSPGRGVQVTSGASGANATSPVSFENVSQIVVTYSTNASSGAGSIAFQVGSNTEVSQNVTSTGGTSDRTLTYNFAPYQTGNVKLTVTCSTNSIYVKSVEITTTSGGGSLTVSNLTITNASTDLSFDLYNNATAQVINYTTSSTGAITIEPASPTSYFSYVHDATNKTITVTPTAVTPSAQTVTINQAADDDYYAGSASFTVSVANSTPLANIAALTAQTAGSYTVSLTDALITYIHGKYAYLEDATGAVLLYDCASNLAVGDKITGTANVTYTIFNGLPEETAFTLATGYTLTPNNTVTPAEVTIATLESNFTSYISRYVKIVGATVTSAFNNRNSTIEQSGSSIVLRDQNNPGTLTTTVNDIVTVTAHPYNTTHQIAVYEQSQIVVAKVNPTITFNNGSVRVGQTLDLSTLFSSNSNGAVTYSITAGDSYATLSGSELTGTAEGSVTVKAAQAETTSYNAGEATATITVNPALVLSSIAVTTVPTKTIYNAGETFDPTGMVVTATYTDNSTEAVTGYTYSPDGALATTDTEITISYTENNVTKTTTQAITVNEVVDYATLPFNYEGGVLDDFLGMDGTSHSLNDQGSYAAGNAPYRIKFTATGDYLQVKTNEQPGAVSIGVKMLGGSTTSTITVQGSADGVTFTNIQELSISGSQNDIVNLETTQAFAATDRYVRLYFNKGSNVGVGPISIATYVAPGNSAPVWSELPTPTIAVNAEYELNLSTYVTGTPTPTISLSTSVSSSLYEFENGLLVFQPTAAGIYEFTFTATNSEGNASATLTVTAVEAATYTIATAITSGRHYVIAATASNVTKAMGGKNATKDYYDAIDASLNGNTITVMPNSGIQEFVIVGPNVDGYYYIYDPVAGGYLYASSSSSNDLSYQKPNDDNGLWEIDFTENTVTAQGTNTHKLLRYNSGSPRFSCYTSGQTAIAFYEKNESDPQYDFYVDIAAWTVDENDPDDQTVKTDNWYFIASPIASPYTLEGTNMVAGTYEDYDLYRLNNTTWENYNEHSDFTTLNNGTGYLYANSQDITLHFSGAINTFTTDNNANVKNLSEGWNLIGNPYNIPIFINKPYYRMNADGDDIETEDGITSKAIPACTGVVVKATDGESVTFSTSAPSNSTGNNGNIQIALAQNVVTRGGSNATSIDNAIVSFNEGSQLEKFYFGTQNANLYIPQNGEEFAIATSDMQGEMPVNFKAAEDGQYTITVNAENVEMGYLHLIDNLTGANVDLLATPSYTFNAKTTDYASRFRLVFSANEANAENDNFAFISNGQIILNGANNNATLQVIDMMGRIVSTQQVNGNNAQMAPVANGVYVLQLINGNEVKTQKIVVK